MKPLLLELRCEELPAGVIEALAVQLAQTIEKALHETSLTESEAEHFATPRRLAVLIADVLDRAADRTERRLGPFVTKAFGDDGKPNAAATGFARSAGLTIEQLERVKTDQGERLQATLNVPGTRLADALDEALEGFIKSITGFGTMRWDQSEAPFPRPVRSLCCVHGPLPVAIHAFGLEANNETRGHPAYPTEIRLEDANAYLPRLRDAKVLADARERRSAIKKQIENLESRSSRKALTGVELVDEITYLTEWPTALLCSFPDSYLDVPREIIELTLIAHQRFVPLEKGGKLSSQFIAFADIESTEPELVREGFERVVEPRLADALFFWRNDVQRGLESMATELPRVEYQRKLGNLADRSERLGEIATCFADDFGLSSQKVRRAAELCKADLCSELVTEFPELQGTIGKRLAFEANEDEEICHALEEHYLPRRAGDRMPKSSLGNLLAIADRADALVGGFAAGLAPRATADPFGLRRAALTLVRLLVEGEHTIVVEELFASARAAYQKQLPMLRHDEDGLRAFFADRALGYFRDKGASPDRFRGVIHAEPAPATMQDIARRLQALEAFAERPEARALAAASKRVRNLLRKSEERPQPADEMLSEEAELELKRALEELEPRIDEALRRADLVAAFTHLAELEGAIAGFFDEVMVMVDDYALRSARLALLDRFAIQCRRVVDLAELDLG